MCTKFQLCRPLSNERVMKIFDIWKVERKKNEQIKGRKSRRRLVLFPSIQQVIPNICNQTPSRYDWKIVESDVKPECTHTYICTKNQNPRHSSSWENFPMYYIEVREGKKGKWKKRQKLITASWFSFPQYTWPFSRCIQNWRLALIGAENSMTEIFIGQKEKSEW